MSKEQRVENPARSLEALSALACQTQLEPVESYQSALKAVREVLVRQGGLVQLPDLPTIIIPDLHARRALLIATLGAPVLEGPLASRQVFELLQEKLINIVCVGDIMHSEERDNWVINEEGDWTPELLNAEMVRSLGAGVMVMSLKTQFPEHFYCLRGNHDDIATELGPYSKFVGVKDGQKVFVDGKPTKGESQIIKDWVLEREGWGQEFLDAWGAFDQALPLLARGSYYIVTHTLPKVALTEADVRDLNRPKELTEELTWSRGIVSKAIEGTLENLGIREQTQRWFYGHTIVEPETNGGRYEEDLDGLVVRLNNSKKHVFAYVPASSDERSFDPARDIYIKAPFEATFAR